MAERAIVGPALAAAWLAAYATAQVVVRDVPDGPLYLSDTAYHLPILLAVVLCARTALRSSGTQRGFWALIAVSCGLWLGGELSWSWYELVRRVPVPFPALPDAFYVASYLPSLAGFVLVFRGAGTLRQSRACWTPPSSRSSSAPSAVRSWWRRRWTAVSPPPRRSRPCRRCWTSPPW